MEGKVIAIVGRKKTGKTTDVKRLIKHVHPDALFLHDVSAQYLDIYKKPLLPFEKFTQLGTKLEKAVIVYEEATIFINHSRQENIINLISTSRHRQNTSIFVFHSLRSLPRYIFDFTDVMILHKTKDTLKLVEEKFEDDEFTACFNRVNAHPDFHYSETFNT